MKPFEGVGNFLEFVHDLKGYFEVMRPDLCPLLDWIECQPELVDIKVAERLYPNLESLSRQLHGYLRHKLKGVARLWFKDKDPARGVQNWREMLQKYEPSLGPRCLTYKDASAT